MKEALWGLLSLSLSGAVLTLLLLVLLPLIKRRASKAFSYYVWLLVALRLLLPVGYGVGLSGLLPSDAGEAGRAAEAPLQAEEAQGSAPAEHAQGSAPDTPGAWEEESPSLSVVEHLAGPQTNDGLDDLDTWLSVVEHLTGRQTPAAERSAAKGEATAVLIFGVWAAGAAGVLVWHAAAYAAFSRKIRKSLGEPPPEYLEVLKGLEPKKNLRLACSSYAEAPVLVGLFRPVIVLPRKTDAVWKTEGALAAVLQHELTHARRLDIACKWLFLLAAALHWFNPLAHLARRRADRACELSCDEAVIQRMDGAGRKNYGNLLLQLAAAPAGRAAGMAMALSESRSKKELKERLGGIMTYKKTTRAAKVLMLLLAVALACCACAVADLGENGADEARNQLKEVGIAPYVLTAEQEELLTILMRRVDIGIFAYNGPEEAITMNIRLYELGPSGWEETEKGGLSIGTEREPVDRLTGVFAVQLREDRGFDLYVDKMAAYRWDPPEELEETYAAVWKGFLQEFCKAELNAEIPVVLIAYTNETRFEMSQIPQLQDYFAPENLSGNEIVQVITVEFTENVL